ncbi:MAG: 30S ribosomal protein S8 [Verrucomicrobia bacterium RIFCSPHIGHO2_12_FULL_41_10]|nr:MAG: 30S ribosomal protein S8 [Verrucomicrobia bacterium RIFCSPHIGHO2_12_FULL_41_10]HLB32829.1 30S ribosomal protein S8 [Chthoniobacterales bacterium]
MSALTDPIADLLTRIRNATSVQKKEFFAPYSKMKSDILAILKREGYIQDYELDHTETHPRLKIIARYVAKSSSGRQEQSSAIVGLRRISRPGLRRYVGSEEIPRVLGGLGISILSTSRGILAGHEARKQNIGGELLAYVW